MLVMMLVGIFVCARMFLVSNGRPPCCSRWRREESLLETAKRRCANGETDEEELEEFEKTIV